MRRSIGELVCDLTTLGELQAKLFVTDARDCARRVAWPGAAAAIGLVLVLAALPVLLGGFAALLAQAGWLSPAVALLLVGGLAVLTGGLVALIAYLRLQRVLEPLARSRVELERNVEWIKHVLRERT